MMFVSISEFWKDDLLDTVNEVSAGNSNTNAPRRVSTKLLTGILISQSPRHNSSSEDRHFSCTEFALPAAVAPKDPNDLRRAEVRVDELRVRGLVPPERLTVIGFPLNANRGIEELL